MNISYLKENTSADKILLGYTNEAEKLTWYIECFINNTFKLYNGSNPKINPVLVDEYNNLFDAIISSESLYHELDLRISEKMYIGLQYVKCSSNSSIFLSNLPDGGDSSWHIECLVTNEFKLNHTLYDKNGSIKKSIGIGTFPNLYSAIVEAEKLVD